MSFQWCKLICYGTLLNQQLQTVWAISILMRQYRQLKKRASFLKQFVSGASEEMLTLLLQFSTGAANLIAGSSIQVQFVNQHGYNLISHQPPASKHWPYPNNSILLSSSKLFDKSFQCCIQTCFGTVCMVGKPKKYV